MELVIGDKPLIEDIGCGIDEVDWLKMINEWMMSKQ